MYFLAARSILAVHGCALKRRCRSCVALKDNAQAGLTGPLSWIDTTLGLAIQSTRSKVSLDENTNSG
jgi:hypothetical protein